MSNSPSPTEGMDASQDPGWELMHRVDSAIRQNPHLNGHQVFCQHEQGIVVLHGRVKSFFQKQMAQEALKHLEGVEKVINELEVEWMSRLGGIPARPTHFPLADDRVSGRESQTS